MRKWIKLTPKQWRNLATALTSLAVLLVAWNVWSCLREDRPGISNDEMWQTYIKGLESSNPSLVASSLESLAEVEARRDEAIPLARSRLGDENPVVAGAAATAVGMLKDGESAPRLLKMLEGDKPMAVAGAATGLGLLKDKRAVDPLLALLDAESGEVRRAAIEALGSIGDTRAIEPIEQLRAEPLLGVMDAHSQTLKDALDRAIMTALKQLKGGGESKE
jgi:HEAT repeat protein